MHVNECHIMKCVSRVRNVGQLHVPNYSESVLTWSALIGITLQCAAVQKSLSSTTTELQSKCVRALLKMSEVGVIMISSNSWEACLSLFEQ